MADTRGQKLAELEQDLITNATQYSFIQAYKLLCQLVLAKKAEPLKVIRIRPALTLSLMRSEVVSIEKVFVDEKNELYFLEVNLMGLYGQSSPLPKFFTEEIMQAHAKESDAARLFLDLIHQRLYQLLFEAQTRNLPHINPNGKNQIYDFMFSLIGFRDKVWLNDFPDPSFLLRNINLFRHQKGTASGLKQLVSRLFTHSSVEVSQYETRDLVMPKSQRFTLAQQGDCLGVSTLLGHKIKDSQSKILIAINPISEQEFNFWINTPQNWLSLKQLIRYFVVQPLLIDIKLVIEHGDLLTLSLDNAQPAKLGLNTWLHPDSQHHTVQSQMRLL